MGFTSSPPHRCCWKFNLTKLKDSCDHRYLQPYKQCTTTNHQLTILLNISHTLFSPLTPKLKILIKSAIWPILAPIKLNDTYLQIMKFEDFLMEQTHEQHKRQQLEDEVEKLQAELDGELALNTVLHSAHHAPVFSHPSLSPLLPPQVQVLLAELAMVEEEITWLERKVERLKIGLYHERRVTQKLQRLPQPPQRHRRPPRRQWSNHLTSRPGNASMPKNLEHKSRSQNSDEYNKVKVVRHNRRASLGSMSDLLSMPSSSSNEGFYEKSRKMKHAGTLTSRSREHADEEIDGIEKPNELSEELIKCLIGIFLELNQACLEREEESAIVPKLTLSCMNSRSFAAKNSFSSKEPTFLINDKYASSSFDPYGILPDLDCSSTVRDVGPYKNFIQITRRTLDASRFSECLPAIGKLRGLMHKLCTVDLTFLTYKQKLAFWINIYNACIMHAFLEHGLPSTQEKLLAIMNKAALNVGGIVLNALAIEHFILRHPSESKHGAADEKEMLLRHAYGLGYPETNVTFALCRGSWSSPALRVYTPDDVVNELGRARVEYLEASVGVTSKRKIVVPKLLQWHMRDFADDMESLLEWIYSQLPRTGSLKRLIMECLNGDSKSPMGKMVEMQPYESEFRYLLSL